MVNLKTNVPDINLERDLVSPELEEEILLGMEAAELASQKRKRPHKFRINLATILISAFIFLAILAWFEFIQTAFYEYLYPSASSEEIVPSYVKFWYCLLISGLVIVLVLLVYYYCYDDLT